MANSSSAYPSYPPPIGQLKGAKSNLASGRLEAKQDARRVQTVSTLFHLYLFAASEPKALTRIVCLP